VVGETIHCNTLISLSSVSLFQLNYVNREKCVTLELFCVDAVNRFREINSSNNKLETWFCSVFVQECAFCCRFKTRCSLKALMLETLIEIMKVINQVP
jgi:hypothetical protein